MILASCRGFIGPWRRPGRRLIRAVAGVILAFGPHARAEQSRPPDPRPMRVVSVDFCADQYVLGLADRRQIAGLSPDARKDFSFLRAEASGIPQIRPDLERIVSLKADLVVRAYGGGPLLSQRLRQLGIKVVQLSFAEDFAGLEADTKRVATALGREAAGKQRIESMRRQLAPRPPISAPPAGRRAALYLSSGGAVAGPRTLPDEILRAAGFGNVRRTPGWGRADAEALVRAPPQRLVLSFFDLRAARGEIWSLTRHPVLRRLMARIPKAEIPGAMLACPAWFSAGSVAILGEGLRQ